jgi:hypothetical protein
VAGPGRSQRGRKDGRAESGRGRKWGRGARGGGTCRRDSPQEGQNSDLTISARSQRPRSSQCGFMHCTVEPGMRDITSSPAAACSARNGTPNAAKNVGTNWTNAKNCCASVNGSQRERGEERWICFKACGKFQRRCENERQSGIRGCRFGGFGIGIGRLRAGRGGELVELSLQIGQIGFGLI